VLSSLTALAVLGSGKLTVTKENMPTFERCPKEVNRLADELFQKFEENKPLENLKIDYVFAYGERDDVTEALLQPAIKDKGREVQGICRKTNLKERALGHGDIEICLDGDWWETATTPQRLALLDHELHHVVVTDKTDDMERPIIKLREHDFEVGWFRVIAERHGRASGECAQAAKVMLDHGQAFWPDIAQPEQATTRRLELNTK
jgi:hypothetical protein